jgi:hypothetical protein
MSTAIFNASSIATVPTFSPSASIRRTFGTVISLFARGPLRVGLKSRIGLAI